MRLRLLTIIGAATLALAAPSAALAHHHGHKHNAKAHRHFKGHHAQFHFEHIGPSGVSGPTTTPPPPPPSSPTTTPEPNAGEVVSYSKETGMLQLMLTDKETVSGKVTPDTKIECVSETPTTTPPTSGEPTDGSPGDDSGSGDDQSRGDMSQSGDKTEQSSDQTDQEDGSDDDGANPTTAPEPPCDATLLETLPRKVRSAELRIGPSGDEFEELVLVR